MRRRLYAFMQHGLKGSRAPAVSRLRTVPAFRRSPAPRRPGLAVRVLAAIPGSTRRIP